MNEWKTLINIVEKYGGDITFVAECLYVYLSENCAEDFEFISDLYEVISNEVPSDR